MEEKKRGQKPQSSSDEDSDDNENKVHSCPICGHGAYLHARSVHQHVVRKHPNYKKLYMNKLKGKIKYRSPKKKCTYCLVRI